MSVSARTDLIQVLANMPTLTDPYSAYAHARATTPVYWSDLLGSWVLTRYQDCEAVLRDSQAFAADWRRIGEKRPESRLSIQTLDPPEHTRIRHFVVDALRTLDLRALEKTIADEVRTRLGRLHQRSEFDYIAEFASPLALTTITAILGVDPIDPAWFLPVSQAIVDGMDAGIWPETGGPAVTAREELASFAAGWLARPAREGLAGYVAANASSSGIARAILLNTLRVVLHAGFESAGRLLGNGLVTLMARQDSLSRLARGDISLAIEELVRYDPPVQADARACVAETMVGECLIKAGDPVTMFLGAANRDPSRFADADTLDLARKPNPHLGFGRGAHACLGQSLATLQARIVFGVLATGYPRLHAVSEPEYRRNLTLRGVASYQVCLR